MYQWKKAAHNRIDLTGQVFGNLTVEVLVGSKRGGKQCVWRCRCECGNTTNVASNTLRSGHTKSCGCLKSKPSTRFKGHELLSGSYWWSIKNNAFKRGLTFNITAEQAWEKFEIQGRRCALTGAELVLVRNYRDHKDKQTASLDRINSKKGYTPDNIQWLHKDVNNMKQHYGQKEFIEWCRRVVQRQDDNLYLTGV